MKEWIKWVLAILVVGLMNVVAFVLNKYVSFSDLGLIITEIIILYMGFMTYFLLTMGIIPESFVAPFAGMIFIVMVIQLLMLYSEFIQTLGTLVSLSIEGVFTMISMRGLLLLRERYK